MSGPHWSYEQITSAAETQIAGYMDAARRYGLGQDKANERDNTNLAFGAFLLWRELTKGFRNEDDMVRLNKMLQAAL